jgi:hypothetical protein
MNLTARSLFGVDFSGATDAGRKIWIAAGRVDGHTLRIDTCRCGETLPGSSRERAHALGALRTLVGEVGPSIFGLDFPLSLPEPLLQSQSWARFVCAFARRYPSPQAFRGACLAAASGKELKRVTDRESKTPFSPYNLRLYRQTYYGLRDLIEPLVRARLASVLPMQRPQPDRPWLIEICPASTLKQLYLYTPYKGRQPQHQAARASIVRAIRQIGPVRLSRPVASSVVADPEGDALDSVIAALAVYRVWRDQVLSTASFRRVYRREGYVFV